MKKLFIMPLLAALTLVGCKKDDAEGLGNGDTETHYLAVSIVSTPSEGTRAGEEDRATEKDYVDGTGKENEVTSVRFYFFNSANNAVAVKKGSTVNYYDWYNPDVETGKEPDNVEKILKAVLLVETNKGDQLPASIVAVVNPNRENLGSSSLSFSALTQKTDDYAKLVNVENVDDQSFVMSNSVYLSTSGSVIKATAVDKSSYQKTSKDATEHPVVIYVERNVAKVRMTSSLKLADADKGLIKVTDKDGNAITIVEPDATVEGGTTGDPAVKAVGKQVYVKLNGWNLTATLDKGLLVKQLKSSWLNQDIFENQMSWNVPARYRSFWADQCPGAVNRYDNFTNASKYNFIDNNYAYCNENAEISGVNSIKKTKVIFPATLCDENGNPLTICEYLGARFIDNDSFEHLKDQILNMLRSDQGHSHYKKTTGTTSEGTEEVYTEISREDIEFQTATAAGEVGEGDAGRYYVFAHLTDEAAKATWHTSNVEGNTNTTNADEINNHLKDMQHAKIWKSGKTYYYIDIEHFGSKTGVVRNHIYNMDLTALYGIGTPVYDPDETIYPEKPVDEDTYIAAQIKILSWRVVNNKVELDWGD